MTLLFVLLSRMALLEGADGCFALVEIKNLSGHYNRIDWLETEHGKVGIEYKTIGGHNPEDHDLIDVRSLPDGVVARPMHIDLPDGDTGYVCLMEYLGG